MKNKFEDAIEDLGKANETTRKKMDELDTKITFETAKKEVEIKATNEKIEIKKASDTNAGSEKPTVDMILPTFYRKAESYNPSNFYENWTHT